MRKLLFTAVVLFGIQGQAQKKLEVYNFSVFPIKIYDILTNASGSFPRFQSKGATIDVAAGDSYILENSSDIYRFPFHSPLSVPYIQSWNRTNPSGNLTSADAWTLGDDQTLGGMSLGVPNVVDGYVSVANPTLVWTGIGYNLTVIYEMYVNPNNQNDITYFIVIQ